jgi:Fur family ferric uptake transcriptional regulator
MDGLGRQYDGIRMTKQREVILDELRHTRTHPTASEMYHLVHRKLPHLSLATVYRNLELLADAGLARRIAPSGREMRFDADLTDHQHMRCKECGRVLDLPIKLSNALDRLCPNAEKLGIVDVKIEFVTVCNSCKARKDATGEMQERGR